MTAFLPGDAVRVDIVEPGSGYRSLVAGHVYGFVLNAGGEYDVIISPAEYRDADDREDLERLFRRCDVALADLAEGPVFILRNCQPEWMAAADDPKGR